MNQEKKPCHLCKFMKIAGLVIFGFLIGFIFGVLL